MFGGNTNKVITKILNDEGITEPFSTVSADTCNS